MVKQRKNEAIYCSDSEEEVKLVRGDSEVEAPQVLDVLVVDDNFFNIDVLEILISTNYPDAKVTSRYSGEEALEAISQRIQLEERIFPLMLFDINMPEMSGFELENKVR